LQQFQQFDQWLFKKINGQWTNSFFDLIAPYLRQGNLWMPLYLFVLVFMILNYRKNSMWWIVLFICTVALTDMTGTRLFKHVFERLRPCNDPFFSDSVRLLVKNCSPGYSFISNHAANHFGMAAFFYFTMRKYLPKWAWLGWVWAFLIVYSQVYVGIHYPTDVIAGAILGAVFGSLTALLFNKKFGFANFDGHPTVTS
jgi:membrane-associated phospholipid phosphatase